MILVTLKELRKALAELYPEEGAIRSFIDFGCTSIKSVAIDFRGSALVMWSKVLTEAMKHSNGITEIMSNANEEYPDNIIIKTAHSIGVAFDGVKEEKGETEEKYVPFRNILKNINKDRFGEIRRVDCNRSAQVKQYYKAIDKQCVIIYTLGNVYDKPNSFAERVMLHTLEDTKDVASGKQNCWLYRKPDGDKRVDEIPFRIRPVLKTSKNNFCTLLESLFKGLNMDKINEYFAIQKYKYFSLSIGYNYSLGDEILELFTAWIYEVFSEIPDTKFQIFFVFNGFPSYDAFEKDITKITKSLNPIPVVSIKVTEPVSDFDIDSWKSQVNLTSYTHEEFINDLVHLKISEKDINEYKKSKKLTMLTMEKFQSNLYDAYYKKT